MRSLLRMPKMFWKEHNQCDKDIKFIQIQILSTLLIIILFSHGCILYPITLCQFIFIRCIGPYGKWYYLVDPLKIMEKRSSLVNDSLRKDTSGECNAIKLLRSAINVRNHNPSYSLRKITRGTHLPFALWYNFQWTNVSCTNYLFDSCLCKFQNQMFSIYNVNPNGVLLKHFYWNFLYSQDNIWSCLLKERKSLVIIQSSDLKYQK